MVRSYICLLRLSEQCLLVLADSNILGERQVKIHGVSGCTLLDAMLRQYKCKPAHIGIKLRWEK